MLLELSALSQVPAAHRVVEAPGPQFGPVVGDVDAAGPISVALELPVKEHVPNTIIHQQPHAEILTHHVIMYGAEFNPSLRFTAT